ncbi:hypothetical protein [Cellulosilyticum ruminicola]|uniref:hypothetical protein n=1 Tax=Cellulosilyticum ruminicola TaxID=425254 RepID=UPI0006D00017|nr:hypothetical protein [Cellulosilyticum ruminicola]
MNIETIHEAQFQQAYGKIVLHERKRTSIGTLSEKTLHAVLKHYFEPDESKQEIKVGTYYADICTQQGIIEIQTRQFNKLRAKLTYFLEQYPVTIVYPIPYQKWIYWVDEETGEISGGRRSPKKGNFYEAFIELYRIKEFLNHKNFRLCLVLVDVEEYKRLNGWNKNRKRGSHRKDRIPIALQEILYIQQAADYQKLLPKDLPEEFDSKEFAKTAKIPTRLAQMSLNILLEVGLVNRIGKRGRSYMYEINN